MQQAAALHRFATGTAGCEKRLQVAANDAPPSLGTGGAPASQHLPHSAHLTAPILRTWLNALGRFFLVLLGSSTMLASSASPSETISRSSSSVSAGAAASPGAPGASMAIAPGSCCCCCCWGLPGPACACSNGEGLAAAGEAAPPAVSAATSSPAGSGGESLLNNPACVSTLCGRTHSTGMLPLGMLLLSSWLAREIGAAAAGGRAAGAAAVGGAAVAGAGAAGPLLSCAAANTSSKLGAPLRLGLAALQEMGSTRPCGLKHACCAAPQQRKQAGTSGTMRFQCHWMQPVRCTPKDSPLDRRMLPLLDSIKNAAQRLDLHLSRRPAQPVTAGRLCMLAATLDFREQASKATAHCRRGLHS